jgi:hypothetical protein
VIIRMWHGWTSREDADDYQHLLDSHVLPAIIARGIVGLHGIDAMRRDVGDEVEFVTVMNFEDHQAVQEFAGAEATASVVPDEARELLLRFDEHSAHYELVTRHLAPYDTAVRPSAEAD